MKRFLGIFAVLVGSTLVGGCSDLSDTLLPEVPEGTDSQTYGSSADISDGTTDGRPYFFFLNPFTKSKLKPNQVGVFDPTLEPVVTICPMDSWNLASQTCDPVEVHVEYPFSPGGQRVELVLSAEKYQVVYKAQDDPLDILYTYRVAVSIYGKTLGWADMALYNPVNPDHEVGPGEFTWDDVLLLNGNENQNISFRIDEGALEAQFCDPSTIEDCDVAFIDPNQGGILRVIDDNDPNIPTLGAIVDIPAGILGPDGLPYPNKVPFVLELEFNNTPQPSEVIPAGRQYPYFIDLWTPVEGLYFPRLDENSPGANITVCQEETGGYSVPEDLHDYLVLFLVRTFSNGSTSTELLPTEPGAADCEGLDPSFHAETHQMGEGGLLSQMAAGFSRVSRFFLPQPLFAKRRLHGGLNTVVWEISPKDGEGRDAVSGVKFAGDDPELLQIGSVLNVDAATTSGTVTVTDPGFVGEASEITIQVLDVMGEPFLFQVDVTVEVTVEVTGANPTTTSLDITYDPAEMEYSATYTPQVEGLDRISVTVEKAPYLPLTVIGTFDSEIRQVTGPLTAQIKISGSSEAYVDGYPVQLFDADRMLVAEDTTVTSTDPETDLPVGTVTFDNVPYGEDYFVHLAKRDFDVEFIDYTHWVGDFSKTDEPEVFDGTTTTPALPESVEVNRLGAILFPGTGNAYQYVPEGRSWTAAQNQVRETYLNSVPGHLATVYNVATVNGSDVPLDDLNEGENAFIASFLTQICSGAKQCKVRGWLGLTDEAVDGEFVWVSGELSNWWKWDDGEPSDKKPNLDHVEIAPDGKWSAVNGASSTNDGYFVEWDVPRIEIDFTSGG